MNFFDKVYEVVKTVPKGRVISYGKIAELCGNKRMARQVGWALHVNPDPINIPCYRVVNKDGKTSSAFAFGGEDVQKELLKNDGIEFDANGNVKQEYFIK